MTDDERSRTALYSWDQIAAAKPDDTPATAPAVMGASEVCELLGISAEELDGLRAEDFPPATELASGPVWDAAAIQQYSAAKNA